MTIEEALERMRLPSPQVSSEEAAKRAVESFMAEGYFYQGIPMMNHCSCQVLATLGETFDLPCQEMLEWVGVGLQGGVSAGEICGALTGAAIAMGLHAWKVMEPRTGYERRLAGIAVPAYVQELIYAFRHQFDSVRCEDLIGLKGATPEQVERFIRERQWKDTCVHYVDYVVRTLCQWGEDSREAPPVPPIWRKLLGSA